MTLKVSYLGNQNIQELMLVLLGMIDVIHGNRDVILLHLFLVGLLVPDPGSTLISQINPYITGPFNVSLRSAD